MRLRVRWMPISMVALVAAVAGLLAVAGPARAQQAKPAPPAVAAATGTLFTLDGYYTDGGSARPKITSVANDPSRFDIDMSSQGRPNGWGYVLESNTILAFFPDEHQHVGTLTLPGTITWDNGSQWRKITLLTVPDLIGLTKAQALAAVQALGLVPVAHTVVTCDPPGQVAMQSPSAGTQVLPGSLVHFFVVVNPKVCA